MQAHEQPFQIGGQQDDLQISFGGGRDCIAASLAILLNAVCVQKHQPRLQHPPGRVPFQAVPGLIDHLEGITPGALLHIQMEMEPLTVADPLKELDECSVALPLDTDEYDAPDPDATSAAHDRLSYPRKSAQHAAPVLRV